MTIDLEALKNNLLLCGTPAYFRKVGLHNTASIMERLPATIATIQAQADRIAVLEKGLVMVCERWGAQAAGALHLDWEDAADDMHNVAVAALGDKS